MIKQTATFGNLSIGEVPLVVGTISSQKALSNFVSAVEKECDLIEVRLDEVGVDVEWIPTCRSIENLGLPIILTIRLKSEGGKWINKDTERLQFFEEALKNVSCVDVEFKSLLLEPVSKLVKASGKSLLVSFHDLEKTPSLSELTTIATMAAKFASVVKISTRVNSQADVLTLESLLKTDISVPLCVIGMGSLGTSTRVAFPTLGSCLTYGYLDTPSASGQLPARILVQQLRVLSPSYNEQHIIRREVLEYV